MIRVYLMCEISDGMFPDEYAVVIDTEEKQLSMFLPKDIVTLKKNSEECGEIEVKLIDENANFALISLPRAPIEGSKTVKVSKTCLRYLQ